MNEVPVRWTASRRPLHFRSMRPPLKVCPLLLLSLACGKTTESPVASLRATEVVMYAGGSGERALGPFREHAQRISIIAPQAFRVDSFGNVEGGVSPALSAVARDHGVAVMPLIVNPGFNQPIIHRLLADSAARSRAIASMVALAQANGFWGWQFDFENIHVSDRDALTRFYRETADALHAAGYGISIAVVPTDGSVGETPFQRYMQDNWRNGFDVASLAEIGDFVSWMTYAVHGGVTTPGPIAGLPWMRAMVDHAIAEGVAPERLSLGIGTYSGYWAPGWDETRGARVVGREIPWSRARELLAESGSVPIWLPEQGVSYAMWERAGVFEWLFLEDRRSLESKLDLYATYPGLRGISVWVLGAEDPAIWGLLEERLAPTRIS